MYKTFDLGILISTTNHGADDFVGKLAIIAEMEVEVTKDQKERVLVIMPHEGHGAWRTSIIEDVVRKSNGDIRVYTHNSRYVYRRAECEDLPSIF